MQLTTSLALLGLASSAIAARSGRHAGPEFEAPAGWRRDQLDATEFKQKRVYSRPQYSYHKRSGSTVC